MAPSAWGDEPPGERSAESSHTWTELSLRETPQGLVILDAPAIEAHPPVTSVPAEHPDLPPAMPLHTDACGPSITLEPQDAKDGESCRAAKHRQNTMHTRFKLFEIPRDGNSFGLFGFQFQSFPRSQKRTLSSPLMESGFGMTWLDGPDTPDLPSQLYNVGLDLGSTTDVGDRWSWDVGVTPGWYTDWKNLRPESFRLTGRAVAFYQRDEETQWVGGFVHLNRDDIPILPVVGMIWVHPEGQQRWEMVFPSPRISFRLRGDEDSSDWLYLAGELGGGSWAIKRADRKPDVITYRDLKAVIGWESRHQDFSHNSWEFGWVFDRQVSSRTKRGDDSLNDALMFRWIVDY